MSERNIFLLVLKLVSDSGVEGQERRSTASQRKRQNGMADVASLGALSIRFFLEQVQHIANLAVVCISRHYLIFLRR